MNLTTVQLQALKAHVTTNVNTIDVGGSVVAIKDLLHTPDNAFAIAAWYNLPASPAFYVWRTSINTTDVMQNGFGWDRVDNLTVGKARIWDFMTRAGTLDPSRPNVRAGFEACFSVEAGDQATRQAIYNHSQRLASNFEKVFASGAGTASTHHGVGPAVLGTGSDGFPLEGQLSYNDITNAWSS